MAGETPSEYRVLARKYRPSNFDDLIGQGPMVQTLSNAFATGRLAQAYMLTGVRGVGKTTTARILARALNYQSDEVDRPTLDLSQMGDHCGDIMEGNHVDVIEMDAASHTGINDIREIIASVRYKPVSARYKVYIIDEIHMLSNQAFNGLLKTLEEPPEHVKFIFATTEIRKVPITVLSRCQRFDLRRIEAGELTAHLAKISAAETIEAESEALAMIARAAEGSVRDALSLLDQAIAFSAGTQSGKILSQDIRAMLGLADRARVIDLFDKVMRGDITAALEEIKDQYDIGADPQTVLTDLAEFVHFVTRLKYVETALNNPSLSQEEKDRGKEFAASLSPRVLGRTWQMLLKGIAEVQASNRPIAAADMVLVRITHAADLPLVDDVIRSLDKGNPAGVSTPQGGGAPATTAPTNGSQSVSARGGTTMPSPDGGGSTMRQVANGPMLVVDNPSAAPAPALDHDHHHDRAPDHVVEPEQPAPMEQKTATPLAAVYETITSLSDLLDVAEKKRDIRFKLLLRNNFSEVSFEPGRIEFSPVGDAPRDFVRILSDRLREWTGEPWQVVVSDDAGGATVKEQEEALREQQFADAQEDPTVAAVLKAFPKSKILDVRFPKLGNTDGLDEAAAAEAALDNPDNN